MTVTHDDVVLYEGDGEWSALYVGGVLDQVGDHYLADERIRELFGVEHIQSNDFMRGGDARVGVAPTLRDVHEYRDRRLARQQEAADLRSRAEELRRQADALERSAVE